MIEILNLTKVFNDGSENEMIALNNISLQIEDGEMVAIIGKSGSGKSTLIHILACIDDYEEGAYYLDNILVKSLPDHLLSRIRNEKIGLVMQDFALIEEFSAFNNVMLPLDFSLVRKKYREDIALQALDDAGVENLADQMVNTMSGGQKQRVAIARAIANNPSILLADEPTGALDSVTAKEIMMVFKTLNEKGKTIVIVTHDMEIARQCDRIVEIIDGVIYDDNVTVQR